MMLWFEPFMWAYIRAVAFLLQLTGLSGLLLLAGAWTFSKITEE